MMTTRKNKLMIAAAVAALMTGSGFALAQDSSPATKAPSAAPAEKMAPAPNAAQKAPSAAEQKAPSAADKGAQKSEDKSLPSKRSSETAPANKSKTETTGQAPASPGGDKSTTTKSDTTKSDTTKSDTTKSDTTTQSPSKATQDKAGTTSQPNQPNQATGPGSTQKSGGTAGTTTNNTTNVSVNLSPEQRTRIHQVIVSDRNAPRLARVDFQLNVGVAVPRSVKLAPVPTTIVEIQPSWRGYEYFLVGDQIVIVNPRTMEIVAVVPA